jgi:DNA-binding NarL/FixJ family response regulator
VTAAGGFPGLRARGRLGTLGPPNQTDMSAPSQRLRVLCVDDHPFVREGVSRNIDLQPDMEVVATGTTGDEAVDLYLRHRPDITLMDLGLPGMSGLEAIRAIRQADAEARIIVLTMYNGDEDIHLALEAGAAAYVLKTTLADDLVRVVREVYAGKRPMSPDTVTQLAARAMSPHLSQREKNVVKLMAEGMRNKEIAAHLHLSEDTVETHLKRIFAKLNVRDRTAAITTALKRGILHLDD